MRRLTLPGALTLFVVATACAPAGKESVSVDHELAKLVGGDIARAIPVSKDCMVLSYLPEWAHGDVDNIGIANNDGGVRTLVELPDIPPEEALRTGRKFLLAIYSRKTTAHSSASAIVAHEIEIDWPERVSWNTQPRFAAKPSAEIEFVIGNGWRVFDVSSLIRTQAQAKRKSHGVMLRFAREDRSGAAGNWSGYELVSREGEGEWRTRRPALLVVDSSPGPTALDSDLAKLVKGRVVRTAVLNKDCMVLSYLPEWSRGDVDNIGVANNDGGVRTLLAWPEVSAEEAQQPDRQFWLALYSRKTTVSLPAAPIGVHEVVQDWPERTSWKSMPSSSAEPTVRTEFVAGDGWKVVDVTPLVRAQAKEGRRISGVVLRFEKEDRSGAAKNWSGYEFVSREGDGAWRARRPMLLAVEPSQ